MNQLDKPPNIALSMVALLCGPKANETEVGATLFIKSVRERTQSLTCFCVTFVGSKSGRRHGNDKSIGGSRLFKPLDASSDLDPRILGREIAYRLGEVWLFKSIWLP